MPTMPGPLELLVVAALALIVFGPARLPEIARSIGKAVNEFRRQASDLKSEFDLSMDEEPKKASPGGVRAEKTSKPAQDPDPSREEGSETPGGLDPDPTVPTPSEDAGSPAADEPASDKS
jgi:TatA/E family protein of Tat protein translocase